MSTIRTAAAALGTAAIGVIALAGCGSDDAPQDQGGFTPASTTVAVRTIDGKGTALVDKQGRTLYTTEQDTAGKIACANSECTAIWVPLTLPKGSAPTGPAEVTARLSTVARPDGASQVAFGGKPLYTFTLDGAGGAATGDGLSDTLGGIKFTWHAVIVAAATSGPSESSRMPDEDPRYGY